jgi:hypothetical protein
MADTLEIAIGTFMALDAAKNLAEDALANNSFADMLKEVSLMAVQPFVGVIPIKADQYKMTRQVEVSESMVVTQYGQGKEFVVDSAAPHPRVWKIHGYITSLIPLLETGFVIKPTLILQKAYLDGLAESRQPVLFKTTDGEFIRVLIQSLEISESPKVQTAFEIDITVKEFVYLTATSLPPGGVDFSALGAAAAASAPTYAANAAGFVAVSAASIGVTTVIKTATQESSSHYTVPFIRGDELTTEEFYISQTTPTAKAYSIPLGAAADASRLFLEANAGGYTFRFDFRWNYSSEDRYTRLTDLLERTRQGTYVHWLTDEGADGEHLIIHSKLEQPADLRTYMAERIDAYTKFNAYENNVVSAVLNALKSQPVLEPSAARLKAWLADTDEMIGLLEMYAWGKHDIVNISACYSKLLYFRDLLVAPPGGGLLDYLYTHDAAVPRVRAVTEAARRTYRPLQNSYTALDAAERNLSWRCVVSAPALGPRRSFILKKGARFFSGNSRYNITVVAESCMANGNIGYSGYQFADKVNADQFPFTSLVVEILC